MEIIGLMVVIIVGVAAGLFAFAYFIGWLAMRECSDAKIVSCRKIKEAFGIRAGRHLTIAENRMIDRYVIGDMPEELAEQIANGTISAMAILDMFQFMGEATAEDQLEQPVVNDRLSPAQEEAKRRLVTLFESINDGRSCDPAELNYFTAVGLGMTEDFAQAVACGQVSPVEALRVVYNHEPLSPEATKELNRLIGEDDDVPHERKEN